MGDLRPPEVPNVTVYFARETYCPPEVEQDGKTDILTFIQGDEVEVFSPAENGTGYIVRKVQSRKKGFVSDELVTKPCPLMRRDQEPNGIVAPGWYFGNTNVETARRYLFEDYNINGSFLIRDSEKSTSYLTIQYKKFNYIRQSYENKCTRILSFTDTTGQQSFRIMSDKKQGDNSFNSLHGLVEACQKANSPLGMVLTNPCLVTRKQHPRIRGLSCKWASSEAEITVKDYIGPQYPGQLYHATWRGVVPAILKAISFVHDEFEIMRGLHHPNFLSLFSKVEIPQGSIRHLVMEGAFHGTLLNFLRKGDLDAFCAKDAYEILMDVLRGLDYLHNTAHMMHRCLGAHSVFISRQFRAKIGNLGHVKKLDTAGLQELIPANFCHHSSPEVLQSGKFTPQADIWSFGVLVWEILTSGDVPFRGMKRSILLESVCDNGYVLPMPERSLIPGLSLELIEKLYNVSKFCWHLDLEDRPSPDALCTHLKEIVYPDLTIYAADDDYIFEMDKEAQSVSLRKKHRSTATGYMD